MVNLIDNSENYQDYRLIILSEAERILSDKKSFLSGNLKLMDKKLMKILELADFFYLEGEYEISHELITLYKALQVKRFLEF
jgi:hypothetical protein